MEKIDWMRDALAQARFAGEHGEVPIGAVLVYQGEIIAIAGNQVEKDYDPTAHAEILAIRRATQVLKVPRLVNCDLYVTLEPCAMCAQAISLARIRRLYFGAYDPKGGGVDHGAKVFDQPTCNHRPEIFGGIREEECGQLLVQFFQEKRPKP